MPRQHSARHRTTALIPTIALLFVATSCSTFDVEGDGAKTPDSPHGMATRHGSFWGFEWSEWTADKCEHGRGIYRVRYHTNALYALATVGTLGLYVPQDVEWWCQPLELVEVPRSPGKSGSSDPDDLFGDGSR